MYGTLSLKTFNVVYLDPAHDFRLKKSPQNQASLIFLSRMMTLFLFKVSAK